MTMSNAPATLTANSSDMLRFDDPDVQSQMQQMLPQMLVSLLERRYLSTLQPEGCDISAREGDTTQPLLREVTRLARPGAEEDWSQAMPNVLTACYDPGHALVLALHGEGDRHRLYLGARRLSGLGAASTEDFVQAQEGAYKAFMPGLQMGPAKRMDDRDMPALAETLDSAMSLAVLTGIPGGRGGVPFDLRSLDRLVKAVGNHQYALLVVAEPVPSAALDATIDLCRRLRSEIHGYVRATRTNNEGGSHSESHADSESMRQNASKMPATMVGMAVFFELAGNLIFPGLPVATALAGLAQPLISMATMSRMQESQDIHSKSKQISDGKTWSEGGSVELLDANAEACENLLMQYIERLEAGRSSGWWQTAVYIAAHSDAALQSVSGAVRSLCAGAGSKMDPMRVLPMPTHLLREAVTHGQILRLLPAAARQGHPLGPTFDALATCINADELSSLMHLPYKEIPGLPMRDVSEFALSVPPDAPDTITLGWLQDSAGRDLSAVTLASETLNRHVFVTGITGYGKTNTCMQLLLESDRVLQVPFLVLEPAKTEYRGLLKIPGIRDRLNVYTLGGNIGRPLRLNPLAPVPGIPLGRHIDLLKAVFNASFPMYAGMPYVLEEAILEVYAERGWSLYTSENPFLPERANDDERAALTPCLEDLHDKIEVVLKRKSYGQEVHMNMGAALRSRLRSMMVGNKGAVFNTRRSTPIRDLFESPTVIELQNLGDDEEKAFVMALIFVLLYEYAEVRQADLPPSRKGKLQHLTLVEEAHRLLTATHGGGNPEVGDPRGKAVTMFTDMLAEMRAYGEGFIIADQIPTKLAPETLKNSNLKIVHRLAAPDDREATGSCLNLTAQQIRHLNNLTPGMAVVHDERIGEAILTRVMPVKTTLLGEAATGTARQGDRETGRQGAGQAASDSQPSTLNPQPLPYSRAYLHRNAGCRACPSPCDFYPRLEEAQTFPTIQRSLDALMQALTEGSDGREQLEGERKKQGEGKGESAQDAASNLQPGVREQTTTLNWASASGQQPPLAWREWQTWRGLWERNAPVMRFAAAGLREGLTYCAVTQGGHLWLGQYLLARGPQTEDKKLTPEDRLARERAAQALGELVKDWQARTEWDAGAQAVYDRLQPRIVNAVGGEPPFDLPGCAQCPVRCRELAFVNPSLARLDKALRPKLAQITNAGEGVKMLEQAAQTEAATNTDLGRHDALARRHWLYCLLVNLDATGALPPNVRAVHDDMLALLREP